MNEKSLIPSIRFAGFTDAWERRKLGEVTDVFRSGDFIKASDIYEDGEFPVYGGNGLRGFTNIFNYEGCYALIGRQGALCGNVNISTGKAYFTEHAVAVHSNQSNNTRFLFYLLETMNLGKYSAQSAQPGLAVGKLVELTTMFPAKAEQDSIAEYLTRLDTLITLHQRKHEKLLHIKKSMLDKMFPKDGELFPEVRFAGYTAAWERRKLGEVTDVFRSGDFIKASDIYEDGGFPVYGGNGLRGFTNIFNYEGCYALIGRQGALCGNVNLSTGKAYFTEHAVAVHSNQANNTRFLFYLLETMNLGKYSAQSAQPGLAVGKLVELTAMFPAKDEQDSIAAYLTKLVTLITLHQCKIEKLKNIKKACLEKMFV